MAEASGSGSMGKTVGIVGGLGCTVVIGLLAVILIVPTLVVVLAGGIAGQVGLDGNESCAEAVSAEG